MTADMTASPQLAPHPGTLPQYTVSLARDEGDIRAAQRLRHDVFTGELGALLTTPEPGLDIDDFDAHCDHLIVREETTGTVVGTYRLLPPDRAAGAGGLYAETEFDVVALAGIRHDLVEAGRSVVHPDHRDGAVISLMWAGIARYLNQAGHEWLAGCCSVPLADGGGLAADVWETVSTDHLSPAEYRVTPHLPWRPARTPVKAAARLGRASLPPLLRGYLRLGAWVCGEPAHDADFGVADFYVLLSLRRTDPRYLHRFLSMAPVR
ncbi:GNAT family N-acetyltransferase [Streptomyces sp. NPDC019531]|uniref:GNAT family N-acetyltransferase n=1 Tax=Streptomyces sp. NPDC019531 TaxID=3365062 RepID=UPI00384EC35F